MPFFCACLIGLIELYLAPFTAPSVWPFM